MIQWTKFLLTMVLFLFFFLFTDMALPDQPAEIPEYELDEISITATRTERKSAEVPASITVINEAKLEGTRRFNIKEALVGTPGLFIDSKNQGYDSRVIIRGSGLKARYGVRDIMVLMDGVPITDPDSLTRLDFIDTQLIKQIEVVKGPNSTLWGTNAAGGVINVITKSPYERDGVNAKFGMGDFGTHSYHLSYSNQVRESFFYTVSGSHRRTDNSWRRWNKFDTTQGAVQTGLLFDDGSSLESYFGYTDASIQLPGKLDESQFLTYKDTGRAYETYGPWQYSGRRSEIFFINSRYTWENGPWELKPSVFVNQWRHEHPITGKINSADTLTGGLDLQVNYHHGADDTSGTVTFGATARLDSQDTDYYKYRDFLTTPSGRLTEVLSDARGDLIEQQNRRVNLFGVYAQESYRLSDRWRIDLGLRYDVVKFDITGSRSEQYDYASGSYGVTDDPVPVDKTYHDISPRLGVTYRLTDVFHLFGTIAKGIQTPTEGELGENPDLDLVEVFNYEIGLKGRHKRWRCDLGLYYSPVENDVVRIILPDNETDYINAGKTDKKGIEITGSYDLMSGFEIGASYAWSDYRYDEFTETVRTGNKTINADRSGNQLPFIPHHQYSVFATYKHPSGFKAGLSSHSWGAYYMDNANTEKYDGFDFVTSLSLGFEKGPFSVNLTLDNVFDQLYAIEAQKDVGGFKLYNPAPPRSFFIQMGYTF